MNIFRFIAARKHITIENRCSFNFKALIDYCSLAEQSN